MEIISLEPDRVQIFDDLVIKKSTQDEYNSLISAMKYIKTLPPIIIGNNEYKIKVPKATKFENNKIYMERCFGENLELLLRESATHSTGVTYLNELLNFFINNNFGWKDFAPRNILISENEISIMDFEKGLTVPIIDKKEYFIDYVYEEYAAFLLPEERIYNIDKIFTTDKNFYIDIQTIKSKRIKTILNVMGYNKQIPISKYILAAKMIVFNETPYLKNNNIVFPLIELEEYLETQGYEKYALKIKGEYYEKHRNI